MNCEEVRTGRRLRLSCRKSTLLPVSLVWYFTRTSPNKHGTRVGISQSISYLFDGITIG